MKKGLLAVAVSSVLLLAAAPAFAAGPWYGGLEGAAVWISDAKINTTTIKGEASFDTGWGIGLVGGYDFGTFRMEGELIYRISGPDDFSAGGASSGMSGDYTSTSLMVNGFYDFKTLSPSVIPYLGVGIGASNVQADITIGSSRVVDESQIVFAYQFIAGAAFPLSKEWALFADYRYFATTDPSFSSNFVPGNNVDMEYASHNFMLGLRFNF